MVDWLTLVLLGLSIFSVLAGASLERENRQLRKERDFWVQRNLDNMAKHEREREEWTRSRYQRLGRVG